MMKRRQIGFCAAFVTLILFATVTVVHAQTTSPTSTYHLPPTLDPSSGQTFCVLIADPQPNGTAANNIRHYNEYPDQLMMVVDVNNTISHTAHISARIWPLVPVHHPMPPLNGLCEMNTFAFVTEEPAPHGYPVTHWYYNMTVIPAFFPAGCEKEYDVFPRAEKVPNVIFQKVNHSSMGATTHLVLSNFVGPLANVYATEDTCHYVPAQPPPPSSDVSDMPSSLPPHTGDTSYPPTSFHPSPPPTSSSAPAVYPVTLSRYYGITYCAPLTSLPNYDSTHPAHNGWDDAQDKMIVIDTFGNGKNITQFNIKMWSLSGEVDPAATVGRLNHLLCKAESNYISTVAPSRVGDPIHFTVHGWRFTPNSTDSADHNAAFSDCGDKYFPNLGAWQTGLIFPSTYQPALQLHWFSGSFLQDAYLTASMCFQGAPIPSTPPPISTPAPSPLPTNYPVPTYWPNLLPESVGWSFCSPHLINGTIPARVVVDVETPRYRSDYIKEISVRLWPIKLNHDLPAPEGVCQAKMKAYFPYSASQSDSGVISSIHGLRFEPRGCDKWYNFSFKVPVGTVLMFGGMKGVWDTQKYLYWAPGSTYMTTSCCYSSHCTHIQPTSSPYYTPRPYTPAPWYTPTPNWYTPPPTSSPPSFAPEMKNYKWTVDVCKSSDCSSGCADGLEDAEDVRLESNNCIASTASSRTYSMSVSCHVDGTMRFSMYQNTGCYGSSTTAATVPANQCTSGGDGERYFKYNCEDTDSNNNNNGGYGPGSKDSKKDKKDDDDDEVGFTCGVVCIAVAVGVFAVIAIVGIVAIVVVRNRRQKKRRVKAPEEEDVAAADGPAVGVPAAAYTVDAEREMDLTAPAPGRSQTPPHCEVYSPPPHGGKMAAPSPPHQQGDAMSPPAMVVEGVPVSEADALQIMAVEAREASCFGGGGKEDPPLPPPPPSVPPPSNAVEASPPTHQQDDEPREASVIAERNLNDFAPASDAEEEEEPQPILHDDSHDKTQDDKEVVERRKSDEPVDQQLAMGCDAEGDNSATEMKVGDDMQDKHNGDGSGSYEPPTVDIPDNNTPSSAAPDVEAEQSTVDEVDCGNVDTV